MVRRNKKPAALVRTVSVNDVPVIGWREWLSVPTLQIEQIKAKIDTGARTSSIHAFNVRVLTDRGAPHVSFLVHPTQHRRRPEIECVAEIRDERIVKSSTGHREKRYVIRVDVGFGGPTWPIELTLTDRDAMGFRMLLGREAVRGRYLIDCRRSFVSGRSYADLSTVFPVKGRTK